MCPICTMGSPPPPLMGGGVTWPKKHRKHVGAEDAGEHFSLGCTGTGVGGDRHLVTVPPPPPPMGGGPA